MSTVDPSCPEYIPQQFQRNVLGIAAIRRFDRFGRLREHLLLLVLRVFRWRRRVVVGERVGPRTHIVRIVRRLRWGDVVRFGGNGALRRSGRSGAFLAGPRESGLAAGTRLPRGDGGGPRLDRGRRQGSGTGLGGTRSEERRVGKECISRWAPY